MTLVGRRHFKYIDNQSTADEHLNRKHRPDYYIFVLMSIIMLFGLVIMFAIGPQRANLLNYAYGSDYSSNYFFIKQLVSVVIALAAFFIMVVIPYSFWLKNAKNILAGGLFACLVLAIAGFLNWGIAQCSLGACRWFDLGVLGGFQPAELLKFGILIFLAVFLAQRVNNGTINSKDETLIPLVLLVSLALFFIVVLQKDLGTGISLIGTVASMLIIGGLKIKIGLILTLMLVIAGVLMIVLAPHRLERVATFLKFDNSSTSDANSYHIEHAKIALGTGGLFGVGIGNSVQASGYLPEAVNDSIFAIIGETFGFAGIITLMILFFSIMLRILRNMNLLLNTRQKLLVAGIFGWFSSHVILNISSMIGVFPLTGITLPLLSLGGTSLIFISASLGMVFQLSRYTVHPLKIKEGQYENIGSRGRFGRSRHTSRRSSKRAV